MKRSKRVVEDEKLEGEEGEEGEEKEKEGI